MSSFNFNPVVKERKPRIKKESNIISKNVIGVIHIDINAQYYIIINNTNYILSNQSYNCKDREVLFYKGLFNNTKLKTILLKGYSRKDNSQYLPFGVGSICKGNLIKENDIIKFDLKTIIKYDEIYIKESKDAFRYFKNNYDEIKEHLFIDV